MFREPAPLKNLGACADSEGTGRAPGRGRRGALLLHWWEPAWAATVADGALCWATVVVDWQHFDSFNPKIRNSPSKQAVAAEISFSHFLPCCYVSMTAGDATVGGKHGRD